MNTIQKYAVTFGILLAVAVSVWGYQKLTAVGPVEIPRSAVFLRPVESVPILIDESATESGIPKASDLVLSAESVYISDLNSGSVLYKKNDRALRSPASTTKLLTALVALEAYALDDVLTVTIKETRTEGNVVGFYTGEELTVLNVLKAMLIPSGNDAAYVLANSYPAGYDAFIERMNTLAIELGMLGSHFENPAGFDGDMHYTTAYDLAILAREAMKEQVIRDIVKTKELSITDVSGLRTHVLETTNQLLIENSQVVGIKTGTTEKAGQVLVTQYEVGEGGVLVVLMGSQDRFSDTSAIVDWIYTQYQWELYSDS